MTSWRTECSGNHKQERDPDRLLERAIQLGCRWNELCEQQFHALAAHDGDQLAITIAGQQQIAAQFAALIGQWDSLCNGPPPAADTMGEFLKCAIHLHGVNYRNAHALHILNQLAESMNSEVERELCGTYGPSGQAHSRPTVSTRLNYQG